MYIIAVRDRDARSTLALEEYDNHEEWLEKFSGYTIEFRDNPSVEVTGSVGGTKEEFLEQNPEFA
jgi:hypothetical protein